MTLTTHAIVGAAVASFYPQHPVLAFIAAFASHFALDAIPHWDYTLHSRKRDVTNPLNNDLVIGRAFIVDILHIGFDFLLGLGLPLLFLQPAHEALQWNLLIGATGGMLPDALQFVYFKFRHQPMIALQRFHIWCHARSRITNWKRGIALQMFLVVAVLLLVNYL